MAYFLLCMCYHTHTHTRVTKNASMALHASMNLIWLFWMRQAGLGTEWSGKHQSILASHQGQKQEVPH